MISHLVLSALVAGSASTTTNPKEYLRSDPLLAGSLIRYCEKEAPKKCTTIDRQHETISDEAKVLKELPLKLAEIYGDFNSLSVKFPKSDKASLNFDLSFESKKESKSK
jgi:hypothetical protein